MDEQNSCSVCGNSPAHLNYGAIICGGCRVFFYRSIKFNISTKCSKNGRCHINKVKRGTCPACRFRRCIAMNLDPARVSQRTYKNVVADLSHELINKSMAFYHSIITTRYPLIIPSSIEAIQNCQMQSMNWYGGHPNNTTYSNINISLWDLLQNPEHCSSRETACIDITSSGSPSVAGYCRWLISFVDLLYQTHYFMELPPIDKLKLAQNGIIDYIVLTKTQFSLVYGAISEESFLKQIQRFKPVVIFSELNKRISIYKSLSSSIGPILQEFHFDDFELTAMKLIALFSSPCDISSLGMKIANIAKEAFIVKLTEYIANMRPELSRSDQLKRVEAVMEITRKVKKCTLIVAAFYTELVVKNYDGMAGTLTYDLHVKIF